MGALAEAASPQNSRTIASERAFVAFRHTRTKADALAVDLSLDLVTDRKAFDALETEWNCLFERTARSTQLFQSHAWLWHWCNHFLTSKNDKTVSLAVVTGRRNGRLVIVCPFVRSSSMGLSNLSFMGDPVSQYGDILVEDGPKAISDIRQAWNYALKSTGVDVIHLRKVRADSAIAPFLAQIGTVTTDQQVAPYLAFEGETDFTKFEMRYSKSARRNRKRQLRRLQDQGETTFERLGPGEAARDAVSLALSLKRGWLKNRGLVSAAISDPRTEAFFRDCAADGRHNANVKVGLVRTRGEVAAIELALSCRDRVAVHVIAYNLKFEKTGAGALLMQDSIRQACESGYAVLDLLAPGSNYKFDWTDRAMAVNDHAVGLTAAGRLYASLYLKRMRPAAKSTIEQMPAILRRHLSTVLACMLVVGN